MLLELGQRVKDRPELGNRCQAVCIRCAWMTWEEQVRPCILWRLLFVRENVTWNACEYFILS